MKLSVKRKTKRQNVVLLRSSVAESLSWGVATAADKSSPRLPKSVVAPEGVIFFVPFLCFLWTACTLEEANLFTVTVTAIRMLCPIELMAFDYNHLFSGHVDDEEDEVFLFSLYYSSLPVYPHVSYLYLVFQNHSFFSIKTKITTLLAPLILYWEMWLNIG